MPPPRTVRVERHLDVRSLANAPLVIRPSLAAYANRWVRNLSLPAAALLLLVLFYRLKTNPAGGEVVLVVLAALALVAVLFFFQARIVLDSDSLSYRRLIIGRRFALTMVGGLAIRSVSLSFNSYARTPPPFGVVYDTNRKAVFSLSLALWPSAGIEGLQQALGGDTSDVPLAGREVQEEFPGALPGWLVFTDSHPVWALVIATPLMFVAIVIGILLSDLLTTGKA